MKRSYQLNIGEHIVTKRRILVKIPYVNESYGYLFGKIVDNQIMIVKFLVANKRTSHWFRRLNYDDIWFNGYSPVGSWNYCYIVSQ